MVPGLLGDIWRCRAVNNTRYATRDLSLSTEARTEFLLPSPKAPALIEGQQALVILGLQQQRPGAGQMHRKIAIAAHRHQVPCGRQPWQGLAQIFTDHPSDSTSRRHDAVKRPMFGNPLDRRLGSDLGHARHVIDGIPHEGKPIHNPIGRNPEPLLDAGGIHRFRRAAITGHGVHQHAVIIDQLREILVSRCDHRAHPQGSRLTRDRTDHVIGFHALNHQHRPTQRGHQFLEGPIWRASSSGMEARFALYWSYRSSRKVRPGASKMTAPKRAPPCSR